MDFFLTWLKREDVERIEVLFESRIPNVCKIKSSAAIKFALLLKLLFFFSVGGGRGANFSFHILSKIVATFISFANDKFGFAVPTDCDSATCHSIFFQHACTLHLFAETTRTMWLTLAALSGDQRQMWGGVKGKFFFHLALPARTLLCPVYINPSDLYKSHHSWWWWSSVSLHRYINIQRLRKVEMSWKWKWQTGQRPT